MDAGAGIMKRGIVLLALAALIALLAYGLVTQGASTTIDSALAEGRSAPAPDFELDVLTRGSLERPLERRTEAAFADGRVSLAELSGTPLVLNLWASWCEPCREEAPTLERVWRGTAARGVLFLGINMQDATGDAQAFIEEFGLSYPSLRDPGDAVADDYGATGIPETFFLDGDGEVVSHVIGVASETQLAQGIRAAERGTVLSVSSGGDQRPQR